MRDLLIGNRSINRTIINLILHYLLFVSAAILYYACKEPVEPVIDEIVIEEEYYIRLSDDVIRNINSLDIMIYEASGLKELVQYIRIENNIDKEYSFIGKKNEKIIVVIANSPQSLKKASILKYESCLGLEFSYDEKQSLCPIKYGIFRTDSKHECMIQELGSLNAIVRISHITNNLDGYELLENPRFRLRNISSIICPFRNPPDYPSEFIDKGVFVNLPFDIGMDTQNPGTELSCYPNSSDAYGLCTQLEFECKMFGKIESMLIDLPPLERNTTTELELIINNPDDYECKIIK